MLSKRTGWKSLSTMSVLKRASGCRGSGCGCLSLRMSQTVFPDFSTTSSSLIGPAPVSLVRSCRATLTFPFIIRLENLRATFASSFVFLGSFRPHIDLWIALPSLRSSTISPLSHSDKRRRRHAICSCTLDLACGF